jgi:hypothetical protein
MERVVLGFCGVTLPWLEDVKRDTLHVKRNQTIGQFCGGSCIQECTAVFGDGLANACRTCPD